MTEKNKQTNKQTNKEAIKKRHLRRLKYMAEINEHVMIEWPHFHVLPACMRAASNGNCEGMIGDILQTACMGHLL